MDFVKQWTFNVCVTLIIAVVFSLLSPKGSMGKFFKMILALFITLSFVLPFAEKSIDLDFDFSDYIKDSDSDVNSETYSNLIQAQIKNFLDSKAYNGCIVECKINYYDNEILVDEINISIPDDYEIDEVKNTVYDELGYLAQVKYIGQ